MAFARNIPSRQPTLDLSRFVDTPREQRDPCFHCSLPFDCDPTSRECGLVSTPTGVRSIERDRQDLIEELKASGVIIRVRGNGFIDRADDAETDIERTRRIKREHMRRVRAKEREAREQSTQQ